MTHLRYEGKITRFKNLKEVRDSTGALDVILKRHRKIQEKVIFPYLSAHIPRHEGAIHFLRSEHDDIDRNKVKLRKEIREFPKGDPFLNSGKVYESGIFFVSLLRHHLSFELRNIRLLIRKGLRPDEKQEISDRMNRWLKKYRLRTG